MSTAQERAQSANEGSAPVNTRPETSKPNPTAKATKWDKAPGVVGEDKEKGKGGDKAEESKGDEPKAENAEGLPTDSQAMDVAESAPPPADATTGPSDLPAPASDVIEAAHSTEGKPTTQAVTDTAGTVNDAGPQAGDHPQVPARAENDHLAGDMEPASNVSAPETMAPVDQPEAARERPMSPMFRDDRDHPHFAARYGQAADVPASGNGEQASDEGKKLDERAADLDKREAEVAKREAASKPASATVSHRDVDSQIVGESYVDGATAFGGDPNLSDVAKDALGKVTLCVLMLRNGGVMIGSAEADGMVTSDPSGLRAQARADARSQLDAAHRYAHRMKVAGL